VRVVTVAWPDGSLPAEVDLFGNAISESQSSAVLSPCTDCPLHLRDSCRDVKHRPWRYELQRVWDHSLPLLAWIMLNPSKATAEVSDPTINRCGGFSRSWGYGGFVVGNLFALRSTDPAELMRHPDPVGPENDAYLRAIGEDCRTVVCAWGAYRMVSDGRASEVLRLITDAGATPYCLGRTKIGRPKHPLYVKSDTPLIEYGVTR
jgi:hypothetical protein